MTTRVLIVDDDEAIREVFQRQLGKLGYDVAAAASAEEAMRSVAGQRPALVITDVRLGGTSGLELLQWLRERTPTVDVVVMTAHEDMETAVSAMKNGAFEFLTKPVDLEALERVIGRCVRERKSPAAKSASDFAGPSIESQLVGKAPSMIEVSKMIGAVAMTNTPVLIRGETGTGKEVIAQAIHQNSRNADAPFVPINCTAIPETLLESELFGHKKGAFTGAQSDRKGRFELAENGTIFLDEIGDVSIAFQAKLLRVLQNREYFPVGSERAQHSSARILAATHRPLETMMRDGSFRADLYFRLRVVEIRVPPLRDRRGDIPMLVDRLVARLVNELGRPMPTIRADVYDLLLSYDWPGNVRELENAISRALVVARSTSLAVEHFSFGELVGTEPGEGVTDLSLLAAERDHVLRVLIRFGGNKRKAARALRISRQRLDRILNRHGLDTKRNSVD